MITVRASSEATPDRLWMVVSDVTSWPRYLETFDRVTLADPHVPLGAGSRVHIRQPGLLPSTYEVTEWRAPERFTWVARSPGIMTAATHEVSATATGSQLTLGLAWQGPLAALVRQVLGSRARRMVELEASTLARRAEADG